MSNNKIKKYNAEDIIICPHSYRHQLNDASIIQIWQVKTKSPIQKSLDPFFINSSLAHSVKVNSFNNTQISSFLSLDDFDVSIFKIGNRELEVLIRFKYGEYNEDFAYTKNVFLQIDKYVSEITYIQNRQRQDWICFRLNRASDCL